MSTAPVRPAGSSRPPTPLATLTVDDAPQDVAFADVKRAVVQVELNRPHDPEVDDTDDSADEE